MQKFKVGDKVKIVGEAFGLYGEVGTVEVVDTVCGGDYCRVSANTAVSHTSQEIDIGRFGTNSWRYGFYAHELELVKDELEFKFKPGDKVRCVHGYSNVFVEGKEYVVEECYWDCGFQFVKIRGDWVDCGWDVSRFELVTDQEVSKSEPKFSVGDEVLLGGCLAEVTSVKQYDTTTLIGVKQGNCFFMVGPKELQHYEKKEFEGDKLTVTINLDDNIRAAITELENRIEYLLSKEPSYEIGQEVYVAGGITRNLKPAIVIDAVVRNGLIKVSVSGFDCYVEEERVYVREEMKTKKGE